MMPSLSPEACRVYEWVLEHGSFDSDLLEAELGLTRSGADEAFKALVDLRLIRRQPDDSKVVAGRPDVAAAELVAPLERQIQRIQLVANQTRSDFDALMSLYLAMGSRRRRNKDVLDLVPDGVSVDVMLDEMAATCSTEVLSMQPGGGQTAAQLERAYPRDLALLERGVQLKSLHQHSARFSAGTRAYVEEVTRAGAQIRTVRELSNKVTIFDREIAFIPATYDSADSRAVMVREPIVVSFLCETFDQFWGHGMEFMGEIKSLDEERALANSVKKSILRLLVQGVRDEAIARRMGISVRTCRRHIAEIMELAGAEIRFQAGYLVAGRHLLDAQD
jgi:hypothetical protein